MFNLIGRLRTQGASNGTINFLIIILAIFLFLAGIGCLVIVFLQVIRNEPLSPGIVAILTAISVAAGGLITVSHTTNQINGTAAQASTESAKIAFAAADSQASAVNAAVQATLAAMRQADDNTASIARVNKDAVTNEQLALKENTAATVDNTEATIQEKNNEH